MKIIKISFLILLCSCSLKFDNPLDRIIFLSNDTNEKSFNIHYLDENLEVKSNFENSKQMLGLSQNEFYRFQDSIISIKDNNLQKSIVDHNLIDHQEQILVNDNGLSNCFVYNNLLFYSTNLIKNNKLTIKNLTTKEDNNIDLTSHFVDYFLEDNQKVYFIATHSKTNESSLFQIVHNKQIKLVYDFKENLDINNRIILEDSNIFYVQNRKLININLNKNIKNSYPLKTKNNLLYYDQKKIYLIKKDLIQMDNYSSTLEIFDLKNLESKTIKYQDPIINFEKVEDYFYLNTKKELYQLDITLKNIKKIALNLDYLVGLYHFK